MRAVCNFDCAFAGFAFSAQRTGPTTTPWATVMSRAASIRAFGSMYAPGMFIVRPRSTRIVLVATASETIADARSRCAPGAMLPMVGPNSGCPMPCLTASDFHVGNALDRGVMNTVMNYVV